MFEVLANMILPHLTHDPLRLLAGGMCIGFALALLSVAEFVRRIRIL